MVTKSQTAKKQVKVGKLKLNKETITELSTKDAKKVRGGAKPVGGPLLAKTNNC